MNAVIRKLDWRTYRVIVTDEKDRAVRSAIITRSVYGRWHIEGQVLTHKTRREAVDSILRAAQEAR